MIKWFPLIIVLASILTAGKVSAADAGLDQNARMKVLAQEIADRLEVTKKVQIAIDESRAQLAKVAPGKTPRLTELNRNISKISLSKFDAESSQHVQEANSAITRELLAIFSEAELNYWASTLKSQAGQKFAKYLDSSSFQRMLALPYERMQKIAGEAYRQAAAEDKMNSKTEKAIAPKK